MNRSSTIFALALLLIFSLTSLVQADDTAHNARVVKDHIIPAYQALANATKDMNEQAKTFCAKPDDTGLEKLRSSFHQSMDAWQSTQHIRIGPIEFLLRRNRLQLWPDKRGSVGKHLHKLLTEKDPLALEAQRFAAGSVAVQGFSALERLLFDKETAANSFSPKSPDSAYSCSVVQAITANLEHISNKLVSEWSQGNDAYLNFITSAAGGNDFYDNDREVSSILLNNLYTELLVIVDQKLDLPMGKSLKQGRGTRAENWRSERSLRNIRLNLETLQKFYRSGFAPRLNDDALNKAIETAFENSLKGVDAISTSLPLAVKDPGARILVEQLRTETSKLKALIGGELPKSLDLSLGFNSLDGD